MYYVLIALGMIAVGFALRMIASTAQQKHRIKEMNGMAAQEQYQDGQLEPFRRLYSQHPSIIPPVPHGASALEFAGWFAEAHRRIEIWAVRNRSAADMAMRIHLQKQINDLEEEHLRYGKTQSEIHLLQHRHEAELAKLELERLRAEDQAEQIREQASQRKNRPKSAPIPREPSPAEAMAQVMREYDEEVEKYPELADRLQRIRDDKIDKIMEGRK